MTTTAREQRIEKYFEMWVKRDFTALESIFENDIYYSECYGSEYCCMEEIWQWMDAMLTKQIVLEWRIKRFIHTQSTTVVEWYFKEQQGEMIHGFDGVSIIDFTSDGKIGTIKEFESKAEHIAPYHTNNK